MLLPFFGTIILVTIASAEVAIFEVYNCQLQSLDVVIIPLKSTSSTVLSISNERVKPSTLPFCIDLIITFWSTFSEFVLLGFCESVLSQATKTNDKTSAIVRMARTTMILFLLDFITNLATIITGHQKSKKYNKCIPADFATNHIF